ASWTADDCFSRPIRSRDADIQGWPNSHYRQYHHIGPDHSRTCDILPGPGIVRETVEIDGTKSGASWLVHRRPEARNATDRDSHRGPELSRRRVQGHSHPG